jgi:hypothetical protein
VTLSTPPAVFLRGTHWNVSELHKIATALPGTVDIVADPAGLAADFEAMMEASMAKEVAGVTLRVWTPQRAAVRFVKQVAPTVEDLNARRIQVTPQALSRLNTDSRQRTLAQTSPAWLHSAPRIAPALVAGCTAEDLQAGDGRVERLAQIATRHADDHRTEIETALAASADSGLS